MVVSLKHRSSTQLLEAHCPAEFISNLLQSVISKRSWRAWLAGSGVFDLGWRKAGKLCRKVGLQEWGWRSML